jgi:HlyD family type I secretion membrane fusion protein
MLKTSTPTLPEASTEGLPTLSSGDFLPKVGNWATLGGWLVLITCSTAALSAVTPFNQVVVAPATIRPQGETRIVQSQLAGKVNQILVQEGQVVSQGTPLATIDPSQWQLQSQQLATSLQNTQAQLVNIDEQLQSLSQQITSENTLNQRTVAAAQADLSRSQREHQTQTVNANTQVQEAEAALKLAQTELERFRSLASAGAISELEVLQKEEAYKAAQARLIRAQSLLNPTTSTLTVAEEQIRQSESRGQARMAELKQQYQGLIQRQLTLRDQLNRDQKSYEQIQQDLRHTTIVAPLSGRILRLNLRNIAQVVQRGDTIVQIEPGQVPLQIKAKVPVSEIAKVKACPTPAPADCQSSQVQMRLSAYPYPDYGTLRGVVTGIAPDATQTEAGATFYEVTIIPAQPYIERQGTRYSLQSGMELSAEIIAREETVLTFLLRKARLLSQI